APTARATRRVARIRPRVEMLSVREPRGTVDGHEGSVGKRGDVVTVGALGASVEPLTMQHRIHCIGARRGRNVAFPQIAKTPVVLAPAFRARTMSGRQRCGFVQKEELGPS